MVRQGTADLWAWNLGLLISTGEHEAMQQQWGEQA